MRNERSLWRALEILMDEFGSSIFQILTNRVPTLYCVREESSTWLDGTYVTSLLPIHAMRFMLLTHLLLAYNEAAPVRLLMLQM